MQDRSPKLRRRMDTLVAEALACKTRMPWERGLRRQAFAARRAAAPRAPAPRAPAPRALAAPAQPCAALVAAE